MNIFITGGAGFIGCNSADHFLQQGHQVTIFDNLSRVGGPANLEWLRGRHGDSHLNFVQGDIREYAALVAALSGPVPGGTDVVLHLASQVAVTLSVKNPREDFEINALGTFNVLEAVRNHCPDAAVLYASTNKVYGGMEEVRIVEEATRYRYADFPHGLPENYPLDFQSPYGCSKGAGDQYTIDYARIYGLNTLVFRQSCIYGPRQFGVEDQGWVAHFIIAAVKNRPLTIFGNGKQVRDLLHVTDLIRAYELGIQSIRQLKGKVYNVGGGPAFSLSIWEEFRPMLESLLQRPLPVQRGDWRPGDQLVFVADIRKAMAELGWQPQISHSEGIGRLFEWVSANPHLFD
jgi:CDP-paratose 2-epimerase